MIREDSKENELLKTETEFGHDIETWIESTNILLQIIIWIDFIKNRINKIEHNSA